MKRPPLIVPLIIPLLLLQLPAYSDDSCLTATCHTAFLKIKRVHPPGNSECSLCHRPSASDHPSGNGKGFSLTAPAEELCFNCHKRFNTKKYNHAPAAAGECNSCHNPHCSEDVKKDQRELCFACHERNSFIQPHAHGPAAVGDCSQCHDPHESDHPALLKKGARELCLECHTDFRDAMNQAQVVHYPVKEQSCTFCHSPHSSSVHFLLKKKMPELCIDCHGDIGKKVTEGKVPHKPAVQEGSCGNCHSSHYSKAQRLLADEERKVCLGCHNVGNMGQPPLKNIQKELEGKKSLHGPVKGACSVCHDPHGSDYPRVLRGRYPSSFYAPYQEGMYEFCLKCHNKSMLRFEKTTIYTEFRNGDQNLHFLHVANRRKGRTCRACHEPHAATGEKLTNIDGMTFGKWKIPVDFKGTETGGSCAPGCHAPYEYDREKPVIYKNP